MSASGVLRLSGRVLAIAAAAAVVTVASAGVVRVLPQRRPPAGLDRRGGGVGRANDARRAEFEARRNRPARERRQASFSRGLPDLAVQVALIGAIAWAGRRFLGLRLKD